MAERKTENVSFEPLKETKFKALVQLTNQHSNLPLPALKSFLIQAVFSLRQQELEEIPIIGTYSLIDTDVDRSTGTYQPFSPTAIAALGSELAERWLVLNQLRPNQAGSPLQFNPETITIANPSFPDLISAAFAWHTNTEGLYVVQFLKESGPETNPRIEERLCHIPPDLVEKMKAGAPKATLIPTSPFTQSMVPFPEKLA